jgi:environmental stress-induced protein Ves
MSTFDETIEKLKIEIGGHVSALKSNEAWSQVEKIYRALGTIEELAGVPRTSLAELFGFAGVDSTVSVVKGEFMGMEALDAAKAYMDKKKTVASTLDEIVDAIQTGGSQTVTRDALRTSLGRSTYEVFKAPGQELYTLIKYLPHVKRGKKKAGQAEQNEQAQTDTAEATPENANEVSG